MRRVELLPTWICEAGYGPGSKYTLEIMILVKYVKVGAISLKFDIL